MSATQRRRTVVEHLLDEPYRFQFFQAVHLLVEWLVEQGIAPDRALTEHILFENNLALSFAPGQIAALRAGRGQPPVTEGELIQALEEDDALQIRITPAFMGFLGNSGTLPFHYTERVAAHLSATRDEAPRAFLDMFSNRALAQFYMAWRKHRVEHAGTVGEDGFLPLLLSFAGFRPDDSKCDDDGAEDEMIALYAGVLMQRPVPPSVLARMLSDYLGVPLDIDESVGQWIELGEEEQCSLGGRNSVLGNNTILGERSLRPDLGARIRVGPLSRAAFERFLPGGDSALALLRLLRLFGSQTISYEVRLTLRAQDIGPLCLSGAGGRPVRLGQDSFLVTETGEADRNDMSYRLTPLPPLSASRSSAAPMAPERNLQMTHVTSYYSASQRAGSSRGGAADDFLPLQPQRQYGT
jgi:type VI secretion system protein ImpH